MRYWPCFRIASEGEENSTLPRNGQGFLPLERGLTPLLRRCKDPGTRTGALRQPAPGLYPPWSRKSRRVPARSSQSDRNCALYVIGHSPGLHLEKGRDGLEGILHPVVDLSCQNLFLGQQTFLVTKKADEFLYLPRLPQDDAVQGRRPRSGDPDLP